MTVKTLWHQLIPFAWIDEATERWHAKSPKGEMLSLGVCSDSGAGSVIVARHADWWIDEPVTVEASAENDAHQLLGRIIQTTRDRSPVHVSCAEDDSLIRLLDGANQPAYQFDLDGRGPPAYTFDRVLPANYGSYLWWTVRELLRPANESGIALPPHKMLIEELCAPCFRIEDNRLNVDNSDAIADRLGRAPTFSLALCLATIETQKFSLEEVERNDDRSGLHPFRGGPIFGRSS